MPEPYIVVVGNDSILGGRQVRWYRTEWHAVNGQPTLIVGQVGVRANGYLDPDLFEAAWKIHLRLLDDEQADVSDVVTHTRSSRFGPLIEVDR